MSTREDILSLAVPVLWQAWRSNDWEAEDNPDWVEFDDEEGARAWVLACMFNGVRPLYAAPTPPAAEAPGQEPVAYLVEHAHSGPVLSWKPPTAGAEAYGWVGTPLFPAPPTYADAEAKGFARGFVAGKEASAVLVESLPPSAFYPGAASSHAAAIRSLASPAPKGET